MRETLDSFYFSLPEQRAAVIAPEPIRDCDARYRYWMMAAVYMLANEYSLPCPPWALAPGFLEQPWFPASIEGLKPWLIYSTPAAFVCRNIFTGEKPLERASKYLPLDELYRLHGLKAAGDDI